MTALQTRQADGAVLDGQEFFRLFQQLESGGDIFEINSSTKALCVGPQSDLANYTVNFFDSQATDNIDEANLAVDNPIIGRIDARLATEYPTASGLPGIILVAARDLVDNSFVPSTFDGGRGDFVAARPIPRIDIFSYLKNPPTLAPQRDDRLYSFPFVAGLVTPITAFYILPYYGRRFGEFTFKNLFNAGLTYTINILGINLFPGIQDAAGVVPGNPKAAETPLGGGPIVVTPGNLANRVFTAEADGMFDLITIGVTTDSGLADIDSVMQLLVSDKVG